MFNFSVDLMKALIWQNNQTPNLNSIVIQKQDWYNANISQFWIDWYNNVFNLDTADDFGISVWGIILDMPLEWDDPSPANYPAWGFASTSQNFDNGNFAVSSSEEYRLTIEQKRMLLKMRYFSLIARGNSLETNRFLHDLLGPNVIYVADMGNMSMKAIQMDHVDYELLRAIKELDLIPRPAAVKLTWDTANTASWGFAPSSDNYDNGNFS